jgi:hypothetical protein
MLDDTAVQRVDVHVPAHVLAVPATTTSSSSSSSSTRFGSSSTQLPQQSSSSSRRYSGSSSGSANNAAAASAAAAIAGTAGLDLEYSDESDSALLVEFGTNNNNTASAADNTLEGLEFADY